MITAIAIANKDLRITEKNVSDSICICFSLLRCMEAIMLSYGIHVLLCYSNRKQANLYVTGEAREDSNVLMQKSMANMNRKLRAS